MQWTGDQWDSVKRIGELCCLMEANAERFVLGALLRTWDTLAKLLTSYIKETDDINEGNVLETRLFQNFQFICGCFFERPNYAVEEADVDLVKKYSGTFSELYLEVQNTVRHEVGNSAETVLRCVFGDTVLPETMCCANLYITTLDSVITIFPFDSLQEERIFSGSSTEFDALGDLSTFVNLVQIVSCKLVNLAQPVEKGKTSRSLLLNILSVLKLCQRLFNAVEKPNLIRCMFLTLSKVLSDLHTKILESVRDKISGPYDNELLSGCEQLLLRLLSRTRNNPPKLLASACKLWKKTFAEAKTLNYSADMRKVLLPLSKRLIYAPGLSKQTQENSGAVDECVDDTSSAMVVSSSGVTRVEDSSTNKGSESSEHSTLSSSRSSHERNHCDTDCGRSLNSSGTKINEKVKSPTTVVVPTSVENERTDETTPRRRSTPIRKRPNLGLLDDDSVEYVPVSSTDSAKRMKLTERQREMFTEKRERMPFLDDDSQQSAVILHLPEEFDPELTQTAATHVTVSPVANFAEHEIGDSSDAVRNELVESSSRGLPEEEFQRIPADCKCFRRKSNVKLNFDRETPLEHVQRRSATIKIADVCETVNELQSNLESSSSVTPAQESESSDALNEVDCTISHDDGLVLREIEDVLVVRESSDANMSKLDTNGVDMDTPPTSLEENMEDVSTPSFIQKLIGTPGILKKANSPSTSEKKCRRVHFCAAIENRSPAYQRVNGEVGGVVVSEKQFPTPSKIASGQLTPRRPFSHVQPAQAESVETLPNIHSAASPVRSQMDFGSSVDDDQPIFPSLANCEESIARIVGRLLPIYTNAGALTTRKSLEAKGVVQIRHLATMTRRESIRLHRPLIKNNHRQLWKLFNRTLRTTLLVLASTDFTSANEQHSTVIAEEQVDETTTNPDDHAQTESTVDADNNMEIGNTVDEPTEAEGSALEAENIQRFEAVMELLKKETVEAVNAGGNHEQLRLTLMRGVKDLLNIVFKSD
ncbi:DNA-binding protein rif1 [Parelaphostrongylus tenuis]|uniref:DNA-binding protein rif1 n=1 Tax=Parelaphostrongylus tenuis TaxID=148309 RepID=A0AAD5MEG2_PARTN|nr:DNA-binding protein rif1 [Parelaphostrongylus tenuis]